MKLPKEYIILEIIPTNSNKDYGFIAQIQALKINSDKIIARLDIRVKDDLITNPDLLKMISYDKEMFDYLDKDIMLERLIDFINDDLLLIIDNTYTLHYLEDIHNKKELVFDYLDMDYSINIFDKLMDKYKLVPSNHLVDLIYEALMYENKNNL